MAISLGVLTYYNKNKTKQSTNIGDQVQTLAQINIYREIVSDFYKKEIEFEEFLDSILKNLYPDFDFIFLPRDNLSEASKYNKKIYMIMNGWFMHPSDDNGDIDWPPPDNIIPTFISFHAANKKLFDLNYIEYYKKHEPIGCRDMTTKRSFDSIGIEAYFSGCLTLTGDYLKWSGDDNNGKTCVIDMKDERLNESDKFVHFKHKSDEFLSFGDSLKYTYLRLLEYSKYKKAITSRLHAYLPCLAMGMPVKFSHPSGDSSIKEWGSKGRFNGLWVMNNKKSRKLHLTQLRLKMLAPRKINKALFTKKKKIMHSNKLNLVFCSDKNYLSKFISVLNSIYKNNLNNNFIIHLIYNDIDDEIINMLESFVLLRFKNMELKTYRKTFDHEYNAIGGDTYQHNEEAHVSVATMLRLFIPELLKEQKKVLYLDCDIVVKINLKEIFEIDVGPSGIALKTSYVKGVMPPETRDAIRRSGNAGVILMDLDILRKNNFTNYCIDLNKARPFNDQVLINIYTEGKYSELEENFNIFASQDSWLIKKHRNYILHYTSHRKPWDKHAYLSSKQFALFSNMSVSSIRLQKEWAVYDIQDDWEQHVRRKRYELSGKR